MDIVKTLQLQGLSEDEVKWGFGRGLMRRFTIEQMVSNMTIYEANPEVYTVQWTVCRKHERCNAHMPGRGKKREAGGFASFFTLNGELVAMRRVEQREGLWWTGEGLLSGHE